jgi:hypothetical protein
MIGSRLACGRVVVRTIPEETNPMEITINICTEPSCYGSATLAEEVPMIVDRLESLIQNEFGHQHDITFVRTGTPRKGGEVSCPDAPDIAMEIAMWIEENWIQALQP